MSRRAARLAGAFLAAAGCLALAGCVERSLTIKSDPPGAQIFMNDKLLGTTPHTYDFVWYGWHRLTLKKPGYEQFDERVLIKSPPYLWIPLDLIVETVPLTVRDTKLLSYRLTPATAMPEPGPPEDLPAPSPEDAPASFP